MTEESETGGEAMIMTRPEAPTTVSTLLSDDGKYVHISFIPPAFNGGSTIQHYRYHVKPENSDVYQEIEATPVTDHSADVDSLLLKAAPWVIRDNSDVHAKVTAVNSVGET